MKGIEEKPYEEYLRSLVQLEKRRLKSELTAVLHLPHKGKRRGSSDLCSV